ncbi:MAG: alpha/beta hydrolase [Fibrobacter sp.]|nr:alpha/beta hydrolase [Fibrobacter sp.]
MVTSKKSPSKNWFAALAVILFVASWASAAGVRYKDRLFEVSAAKTVTVAENVPFLDAKDGDNYNSLSSLMESFGIEPMLYFYKEEITKEQPLVMDVYEPKADNAEKRAAVIVCHGGAFVASSKDDFTQKTVAYTDSLAARGYVTASLEYRQGVLMTEKEASSGTDEIIDSVDFARTVYKAVQDVHAAVRYFRKNAGSLKIDTNKIYIVGNSAGGMLALENIYARSKKDLPSYVDKKGAPSLGELDEYGAAGVGGHANGVVALWGAIHDANLVKNSKVPVFLAHGDSDYVMPFGKGYAISDVNRMLEGKSSYLSMLSMNLVVHTPTLYGSAVIDSILNEGKVYHEFYAPRGFGLKHEFYDATRTDEKGNKVVYADSVQNKVFAFLYNLAVDSVPAWRKPTSLPMVALALASRITMGEGNRSFTVERGENLVYGVFELNGRRVMAGRASRGETVSLEGLGNGVYYLRVQGERARRIGLRK